MKSALFSLVLAATLQAGCNSNESARIDETRQKLVGTWLREVDSNGTKHRRLIVLGREGKFTDRVHTVSPDGRSERQEHAGEWSYDGTNLKRRYLQENGRQFSGGKIRFATFPLKAVSASELVANDNIEGVEVVYRRVADGLAL